MRAIRSAGRSARASCARDDGDGRVVELAAASGLSRVAPDERDADRRVERRHRARSLRAAIGRRAATSCSGSAAARPRTAARACSGRSARRVATTSAVDLDGLAPWLAEVRLPVASDVTNPLLGPQRRGRDLRSAEGRDAGRRSRCSTRTSAATPTCSRRPTGRRERDKPGAGAAGGDGLGLLAIADRFASFEVGPGVEVVMELTGFDDALASADLVLTGEGRIDEQTAFGKTALGRGAAGAGRRRSRASVSAAASTPEGIEALGDGRRRRRAGHGAAQTVEDAMAAGSGARSSARRAAARLMSVA